MGALTPVAIPVAVVALGGVAVGITGHALFVDGPVDGVDDLAEAVEESPTEELSLWSRRAEKDRGRQGDSPVSRVRSSVG